MSNILIENCRIVPMDGTQERWFEGALGIRGQRIAMVSHASEGEAHERRVVRFKTSCGAEPPEVVDARGMVAMPGLVNIHGHSPMSLMRGFADDMPLMRWLNDYIWPFEAGLDEEAVGLGASVSIAEMLAGGTTTFVDMYWMQRAVARAVGRSGMRAVLCPTFVDAKFGEFEEDLCAVMEDYVESRACDGRITAMIAPHSPYSCSERHLQRAAELAGIYGVGLNIHVAETQDEIAIIRRKYGKTPVEFLRDLGLFVRPTLAVHTVYVTPGDIAIFRHNGVAIAHNPQSNMKLASGIAPVARMLEAGLTVGLGTDGCSSNNDLDMWEELRTAAFLQKVATGDPAVLPAYEALRMATIGGARAIGMDERIGSLEEGKLADVILVDMRRPHLQPVHDPVANLAYCGKAADVAMTIVNGRILYRSGAWLTLDPPALISAAQQYITTRADAQQKR